jgi:hypothetical protein
MRAMPTAPSRAGPCPRWSSVICADGRHQASELLLILSDAARHDLASPVLTGLLSLK